jgi:hypothetical protein
MLCIQDSKLFLGNKFEIVHSSNNYDGIVYLAADTLPVEVNGEKLHTNTDIRTGCEPLVYSLPRVVIRVIIKLRYLHNFKRSYEKESDDAD